MKLIQWNSKRYFAKLPYLQRLVDDYAPSGICMQETWLKATKKVAMKYFHFPIRRERFEQDCGGVLIYVWDSIPFATVTYDGVLEAVAVKVFMSNTQVTVCNLYIPPKFDNNILIEELNKLKDRLDSPFILTTDSNAHHYAWGSDFVDMIG